VAHPPATFVTLRVSGRAAGGLARRSHRIGELIKREAHHIIAAACTGKLGDNKGLLFGRFRLKRSV